MAEQLGLGLYGFLKTMEAYSALGFTHVQLALPVSDPVGYVTALEEKVAPDSLSRTARILLRGMMAPFP